MSEWLDLMLEEVRRKEREAREAVEEQRRRAAAATGVRQPAPAQEK